MDLCFPHHDVDAWLSSAENLHSQIATITLPQIQFSGPTSHSEPPPRRQIVSPQSKSAVPEEETFGIRLYSFELEEKQAKAEIEEAKRRLRRIQSTPESDPTPDPFKPMWQGRAAGLAVWAGVGKTRILSVDVEKFCLAFSVEKEAGHEGGEATVKGIAWSFEFTLINSTRQGNEVPNLREVLQIIAVVSSISGRVSKITDEVFCIPL